METFSWPYHLVRTQNPDNSDSMQFGNSYKFVAKPKAPPQRVFILSFPTMQWFVDGGGAADPTQQPNINYYAFQNFYAARGTWDPFIYPHPVFGNLTVRFNKPLADPKGVPGGNGTVEDFEIELIELP